MLTAGAIALPAETDPAHGAGVATEDCGPPPVPPPPPPPTMRTSRDTIPAGTCQGLVETGVRTTSQVPSSAAVGEPLGQTVLDDPAEVTRGITMRIAPVAAATTIVAIVARRDTVARRPAPVVDMRPEPPWRWCPRLRTTRGGTCPVRIETTHGCDRLARGCTIPPSVVRRSTAGRHRWRGRSGAWLP